LQRIFANNTHSQLKIALILIDFGRLQLICYTHTKTVTESTVAKLSIVQ